MAYKLRHNTLKSQFASLLHQAVAENGPSIDEIYGLLSPPPNAQMGDFAFPCFVLSKTLRQAPAKIATELSEKLTTELNSNANSVFSEFQAAGPYLNARVSTQGWIQETLKPVLDGAYFTIPITKDAPKTMIEYSQPNTHKEMHVGHTRNMCLGNALARILKYTQDGVLAVTYPGDMGTHVAKCLWFLKYHNTEPIPDGDGKVKGAWLGKMYSAAHLKLEDELGTDKEDLNRSQLTEILQQLEKGDGEFYQLWQETREWSIELMQVAYRWADIEFDRWYFESEVDTASLEYAKELQERGLAKLDQGAVGVDLNEDKLGFCILIKSDGNGLYATKDLELAKRKYAEGIQKNLYVVDFRQSRHFQQVFRILEKAEILKAPREAIHIAYEMVDMPDGAMSSRKGNIVPLMDLVDNMEKSITENYLEKFRQDWGDARVQETARVIANGAIKYGMLKFDINRKITFEMDEWLKLDGDTGPYLQYVHARIRSLAVKVEAPDSSVPLQFDHPRERELLSKLNWFNDIVEQCADQYKTIHLTSYLFELGRLFNGFYAECPIAKAESEEIRQSRLQLSLAVGAVMREGLSLLGISAPEQM